MSQGFTGNPNTIPATAIAGLAPIATSGSGADLAAGTVPTSALVAGVLNAGKNKIINGSMLVWQRGTSFSFNNGYVADRFTFFKSGANLGALIIPVTQSTDAPTVAQAGTLLPYCLKCTCTTGTTTVTNAADDVNIQTIIEGYHFLPLAQKPMTLSFWVKATVTGAYSVGIQNGGGDQSYVTTYTVNATNTWEYKTITVPASPASGTWHYDTGAGLYILWTIACTTTGTTSTLGSWQAANKNAASTQVNGCSASGNVFQITGIQLEEGSTATALESIPYLVLLQQCQRYCYVLTGNSSTWPIGMGEISVANTQVRVGVQLPVPMRLTPTFAAVVTNSHITVGNGTSSGTATGAPTLNVASPYTAWLFISGTFTVTAGSAGIAYFNGTSSSADTLTFSADF